MTTVDAPLLRSLFDAAFLLAMAAWLGSVLFFSFGVAPVIFRVLDAASAARFVRTLFPRYYAWGATCGAISIPAVLGGPLSYPEYRSGWVAVQAGTLLVCTLIMLYCGNSLTPAINAARDAGPEHQSRFERLHRRSVRLNGLVLVALVALLAGHAFRPAPRTLGIIEPTPQERAAREVDAYRQREAAYLQSLTESRRVPPDRAAGPDR